MKTTTPLIFVLLYAVVGFVSALQGADLPLIRNGDFRLRQSIGPDLRQSWLGGRGIKFEEATDRSAFPSILMEGNAGAMFQNVDLIPGEYELSAGVKVSFTGRAVVKAGKASVEQTETEGWRRVSVRFVCDGSPVRVVLARGRAAKGTVRFSDVRVKALKLESESAPVADGQAIGRIVPPADPKPAETFAAWELHQSISAANDSLLDRDREHAVTARNTLREMLLRLLAGRSGTLRRLRTERDATGSRRDCSRRSVPAQERRL